MHYSLQELVYIYDTPERVLKWIKNHGRTSIDRDNEDTNRSRIRSYVLTWWRSVARRLAEGDSFLRSNPSSGRCGSLGRLKVALPDVSFTLIEKSSLVMRSPCTGEDSVTVPRNESQYEPKSCDFPLETEVKDIGAKKFNWYIPSKCDDPAPINNVTNSSAQLQSSGIEGTKAQSILELPIFFGEYKRSTNMSGRQTDTNQMRMFLTASVKYLDALGITNFPVYGVQTEGPIAAIHAAVMKGEVCIPNVLADVIQMRTIDRICPTECLCLRAAGNRGGHIKANGCLALSDHIVPASRQTLQEAARSVR